jgi:hypothetical protein
MMSVCVAVELAHKIRIQLEIMVINPERQKDGKDGKVLFLIPGILIPVGWNENGEVNSVAIATFDEDEYIVDNLDDMKDLLCLVRQEILATGFVKEKDGKKYFCVVKVLESKKNVIIKR